MNPQEAETKRNIFVVYAHHEPTSFTAAMNNLVVQVLSSQGHNVVASDLYGQGFNALAQKWDFVTTSGKHFNYMYEQKHAAELGMSFAPDITGEIEKLKTAELVIFVAPFWWMSLPAVLKGWFERVLAMGVAWDSGKIYEQGLMRGKQAMLVLSVGHPEDYYGEMGLHKMSLAAILHPINHGVLGFCGFDVHEPFTALNVVGAEQPERDQILKELAFRVENMINSPIWFSKY